MSTQFNCQKHFYFKLFKQLEDRKNVRPARKILRKREFGGLSPFLCCPGKMVQAE